MESKAKNSKFMFEEENYQAGFMMHPASKSPLAVVARYIQKERKEIEELKQKLKIALENVKKAKKAVDLKSRWNYEITKNNFLIIHPKGKKLAQPQLEFNIFEN